MVQPTPVECGACPSRTAGSTSGVPSSQSRGGVRRGPTIQLARAAAASAGRDDDSVLVDLAVDRRPGHAQRLSRLDLIALEVEQALHNGIAFHQLQRTEQPAAYRPAFRRQITRADRA